MEERELVQWQQWATYGSFYAKTPEQKDSVRRFNDFMTNECCVCGKSLHSPDTVQTKPNCKFNHHKSCCRNKCRWEK